MLNQLSKPAEWRASAEGRAEGERFKRLLILWHSPPAVTAGAPIIVRSLFRDYDPDRLSVLCCAKEYREVVAGGHAKSLLPCEHVVFPNYRVFTPRPYRVSRPIVDAINCLRLFPILRAGRRLIRERGVEAIFTATSTAEINLAAYFLSREHGLPLHFFETDDWELCNARGVVRYLIRRYREEIFRSAAGLWLTSPGMVRDFERRFGVSGEFLFHFVDTARYEQPSRDIRPAPAPAPISVVYTGAINNMFRDTLAAFCRLMNDGLTVGGRPVKLSIYSHGCPPQFLGPGVSFEGFAPTERYPEVLARADVLLIAVSFSEDPAIQQLVRTSLYTKTIDYLASARPVLVISPPYSAEIDYFAGVTHVLQSVERGAVEAALARLTGEPEYREELTRRGLELVRKRHSPEALERVFLSRFREV
jgi:glycosyltransferase involved in cell wall biosynthesis